MRLIDAIGSTCVALAVLIIDGLCWASVALAPGMLKLVFAVPGLLFLALFAMALRATVHDWRES